MLRTYDQDLIRKALTLYPFDTLILDIDEWLSDPDNVALVEDGNVALFEEFGRGVYSGHYFFIDRGKKAKELAIRALRTIFEDYNAEAIRGLVPIRHKASDWMTRHLGFKKYGEFETPKERFTIFIMTKSEFNKKAL